MLLFCVSCFQFRNILLIVNFILNARMLTFLRVCKLGRDRTDVPRL